MADQLALDFWLPRGFKRGSLPGTITPLFGGHAGTPMYPESALACVLIAHRAEVHQ